uniref:Uncharacterized protein n=1 Tax=Kalanchoe fedtschenkoi TaxID=63787 RepID=A0A7N0T7T9_KALFE
MSTSFITFNPTALSAAARCKRDPSSNNNRKQPSSTSWFAPLFGWPNTPDYIESAADPQTADPEPKAAAARSRFVPRGFTDEKAKQLRMMTTGRDAFHDVMYHSAIASRLASDFSIKSDF